MERPQDPYIVLTLWFNLALQSDRERDNLEELGLDERIVLKEF
jgi:hypothetical protein